MKRPILYLPKLSDQEILVRGIYGLALGYRFNGHALVDNGWNALVNGYTANGMPVYACMHVYNGARIGITSYGPENWANLLPSYIKVNSIAQFLAYVKANHPKPPAPIAPVAALKKAMENEPIF